MNIDGTNLVQITNGDGEFRPSLTPDGKWIVYDSNYPNEPGSFLWKIPFEGGKPIKLTDKTSANPVVSPNGKLIAFRCIRGGSLPVTVSVIHIDGGIPTHHLDIHSDSWHWTNDSQNLLFFLTVTKAIRIFSKSLRTKNHPNKSPTLNLSEFSISIFQTTAKISYSCAVSKAAMS